MGNPVIPKYILYCYMEFLGFRGSPMPREPEGFEVKFHLEDRGI